MKQWFTYLLVASVVAGLGAAGAALLSSRDADAQGTPTHAGAAAGATSVELRDVLAAYERARDALSADRLDGIAEAGRTMGSSGSAAANGASGAVATELRALATEADALARAAGEDLDAARSAFADVSERLIAVLRADPSLRTGLHLFECPMASSYGCNQWVQTNDRAENPYMGTRMSGCGHEERWTSAS